MTLDQIRVSLARGTCTPAGLKRYECTQRRIDFVTRKRHLHPGRIETSSMCVIAVNPSKLARGTCTPAGLKPIRAPAHCLDILFLARGTCTPAGLKPPERAPGSRLAISRQRHLHPGRIETLIICSQSRLSVRARKRRLHPSRIETRLAHIRSDCHSPRKRHLHPSRIETPLLAVRSPPLGNSQEAPAPRQD